MGIADCDLLNIYDNWNERCEAALVLLKQSMINECKGIPGDCYQECPEIPIIELPVLEKRKDGSRLIDMYAEDARDPERVACDIIEFIQMPDGSTKNVRHPIGYYV
jgi:hypothetical protein